MKMESKRVRNAGIGWIHMSEKMERYTMFVPCVDTGNWHA